MKVDLRIPGSFYDQLRCNLLSGDGKESVAIALCTRLSTPTSLKILVHKIIPIPIEDCFERTPVTVRWSTKKLLDLLESANRKDFTILKIHSHPNGLKSFSSMDDSSDRELFDSLFAWIDNVELHCSAIMLPDGKIIARYFKNNLIPHSIDKVSIIDNDLKFFFFEDVNIVQDFNVRTTQAFGIGTTSMLKKLKVAVVGCSGTGSPTIEQLYRLGIGELVLVDPDKVERKNINRIINSSLTDADNGEYKVDVIRRAITTSGIDTHVRSYPTNLYDSIDTLKEIASCDIIFGCMDSVDGRHLLNQLATFYLIPYFDLGVKLIADGKGGIDQIWGTVHYLLPGKSSLRTRGVYTIDDLAAASLYRENPKHYSSLKQEGYIGNIAVESPAVISVNMQISSIALLEMLSRVHKFRADDSSDSAITRVSMTDCYIQKEGETETDTYLEKFVGRGDTSPFLNMPELSKHAI